MPPGPLSSHLADALYSGHHVPLDRTAMVYGVQTRKKASGQPAEQWPFVSPMSCAQSEAITSFQKELFEEGGL